MSTQITPATTYMPPVELIDDEPELTDDELYELEMMLSRDHDDASYWTGGRHV
jgi:hypothetical protein